MPCWSKVLGSTPDRRRKSRHLACLLVSYMQWNGEGLPSLSKTVKYKNTQLKGREGGREGGGVTRRDWRGIGSDGGS